MQLRAGKNQSSIVRDQAMYSVVVPQYSSYLDLLNVQVGLEVAVCPTRCRTLVRGFLVSGETARDDWLAGVGRLEHSQLDGKTALEVLCTAGALCHFPQTTQVGRDEGGIVPLLCTSSFFLVKLFLRPWTVEHRITGAG